jgi:23S rRNA (guanosine2251-2'-O)-methyltransferase
LQPVREAIRVHRDAVVRVAIDARSNPTLEAVARFATDQGISDVVRLSRGELDSLTRGTTHQGVLCWAPELVLHPISDLVGKPDLLALALDAIQDPQNFGAMIRSAVGVAGAKVMWGEHASAPLSLSTFRASAGAIEHATLCRVPSLVNALTELKAGGAEVVGLDAQVPDLLSDIDLTKPLVLVIGSEHEGLNRAVRRTCTKLARLAVGARVDSLNASVAAGIALYEAANQRAKSGS